MKFMSPVIITEHLKERPNELRKKRQKIDAWNIVQNIQPTCEYLTYYWVNSLETLTENWHELVQVKVFAKNITLLFLDWNGYEQKKQEKK